MVMDERNPTERDESTEQGVKDVAPPATQPEPGTTDQVTPTQASASEGEEKKVEEEKKPEGEQRPRRRGRWRRSG